MRRAISSFQSERHASNNRVLGTGFLFARNASKSEEAQPSVLCTRGPKSRSAGHGNGTRERHGPQRRRLVRRPRRHADDRGPTRSGPVHGHGSVIGVCPSLARRLSFGRLRQRHVEALRPVEGPEQGLHRLLGRSLFVVARRHGGRPFPPRQLGVEPRGEGPPRPRRARLRRRQVDARGPLGAFFYDPQPVWKSNVAAHLLPRPNHDLHAIDATPVRWHGGAGSSPLDGASTAASSSRNDLVKKYRARDSLADFHTARSWSSFSRFPGDVGEPGPMSASSIWRRRATCAQINQ